MENDNLNLPRAARYLIPSLADAIFVIFFLCTAFIFGQKLLADCDTGYHIRAGEYIIKTRSIPHHDLFSFTTPPLPWTAHEWLSEVIMAILHTRFGLTGVVIFFGGLIALTYYLLFRNLRRLNGSIMVALLLIMLVITSSVLHWLARPHIFSLLLMVIWYDLLDRYQYRNDNRLYWLPLLMLFWVNLHGGFITGFILLGIYGAGNLLLSWCGAEAERENCRSRWWQIVKITLLCLLASLVNPFGYHILLFPFNLVNNSYLMDHVSEFLSPNFHETAVLPFKLLLLLLIAMLSVLRRRLNVIEIALLLFFLNMAFYSVRYVTLFAIIAAPIMVRMAINLSSEDNGKLIWWLRRREAGIADIDFQTRGFFWPVLTILAVPLLVLQSGHRIQFDEKIKPVAAVEFLKREHIPGKMFNDDEYGDYIIYSAWPEYRVFFDGRSDMYGTERLKEYGKVLGFTSGWESIMKKYDMNWIIYGANSPFSRYLLERTDWRLIYVDEVSHIFVRNIPLYQPLISKYPNVKPAPADK